MVHYLFPAIYASWIFKITMKFKTYVNDWGGWKNVVDDHNNLSNCRAYKMIQDFVLKVPWRGLMLKNFASPKARLILWLAVEDFVDGHNLANMHCSFVFALCSSLITYVCIVYLLLVA